MDTAPIPLHARTCVRCVYFKARECFVAPPAMAQLGAGEDFVEVPRPDVEPTRPGCSSFKEKA